MRHRVVTLGVAVGLLAVVLVGCASEGSSVKQLQSVLPQERFQAVIWLARHGSEKVLPNFIDLLMDEDPSVRWAAFSALKDRTGETLGYRPEDPEGRRLAATGRWKEWWQKRQEGTVIELQEPEEKGTPGQQGGVPPAEDGANKGREREWSLGFAGDSL
jgi:hypothetical protein